jgi:hypothetical protein
MGHAVAVQIPHISASEDHNIYTGLFNVGWNTAKGSVECLYVIFNITKKSNKILHSVKIVYKHKDILSKQ